MVIGHRLSPDRAHCLRTTLTSGRRKGSRGGRGAVFLTALARAESFRETPAAAGRQWPIRSSFLPAGQAGSSPPGTRAAREARWGLFAARRRGKSATCRRGPGLCRATARGHERGQGAGRRREMAPPGERGALVPPRRSVQPAEARAQPLLLRQALRGILPALRAQPAACALDKIRGEEHRLVVVERPHLELLRLLWPPAEALRAARARQCPQGAAPDACERAPRIASGRRPRSASAIHRSDRGARCDDVLASRAAVPRREAGRPRGGSRVCAEEPSTSIVRPFVRLPGLR